MQDQGRSLKEIAVCEPIQRDGCVVDGKPIPELEKSITKYDLGEREPVQWNIHMQYDFPTYFHNETNDEIDYTCKYLGNERFRAKKARIDAHLREWTYVE